MGTGEWKQPGWLGHFLSDEDCLGLTAFFLMETPRRLPKGGGLRPLGSF